MLGIHGTAARERGINHESEKSYESWVLGKRETQSKRSGNKRSGNGQTEKSNPSVEWTRISADRILVAGILVSYLGFKV